MTARLQATWSRPRPAGQRTQPATGALRTAGVSVGFLAAGVAHEINNPLASIAFCAEALERRLRADKPRPPTRGDRRSIPKYLEMIQQEAFRCKDITQKLLEFSRVGERRREPTDLAELVQAVLEIAQHCRTAGARPSMFQPQQRRSSALVNGQDIKSVVLNLVVNALDSMDEGGTLTISRAAARPPGGIDFPRHRLRHGRRKCWRTSSSRSSRAAGRARARAWGCSSATRSCPARRRDRGALRGPGQGSTFTVRFPLQPAAEAPVELSRAA